MMQTRSWILGLLISTQTMGLAIVRPLPTSGGELPTVRFAATAPTGLSWEIYAGEDKGLYREEGVKLALNWIQSPPEITRGVSAGSIDIGHGGTHFVIISAHKGGATRVIGGSTYTVPYDIVGQPRYKSLKELKGTTVGYASLTSLLTLQFEEVLRRAGVEKGEYRFVGMGGSGERYAALLSGRISATYLTAPFNFQANDKGYPTLAAYGDYLKKNLYTATSVHTEFGKRRPDLVVKFLKAEIRALRWVNDPRNKEEAIKLLLKWLKIDEPIGRRTYKYLVEDQKVFSGNGEVDPEGMQVTIDLLARNGVIKDPKPWTAYADVSFLRQAQRELGLTR